MAGHFVQGRPVGEIVWHENGIPTIAETYETRLLRLGPDGEASPMAHDCTWDYDHEQVVSAAPGDGACERASALLGQRAFSPAVLRDFARPAWSVPEPPRAGTLSAHPPALPSRPQSLREPTQVRRRHSFDQDADDTERLSTRHAGALCSTERSRAT
jgi:hypothetical protein